MDTVQKADSTIIADLVQKFRGTGKKFSLADFAEILGAAFHQVK
jgi:hypothetical protein